MLNSNYEEQCKKILEKLHFQTIRKIGRGSYGHVILASKFTTSANFYAIKCISLKKNHRNPSHFALVSRQTKAMCAIDHPNVVRLQNSFQESGWQFIVMQYCDMGNLMQYQSKNPQKVLSLSESIKILQQILRGTLAIHSLNIMHRDLKCQNIFLKKNKNGGYICKIGDFGLAKFVQDTAKTACGTVFFMAPEVMADLPYSFQADIWSIGVIFYHMLYGDFPFKKLNIQKEIQDKCQNGFILSEMPPSLKGSKDQKHLQNLFYQIFTLNPKNRIKLEDIMNHPLIRSQLETASDSGNEDQIEQQIQWQLERIIFVWNTLKIITEQKILQGYLFYAFKFYLTKVMRIFISKEEINIFKKTNPKHKLTAKIDNKLTTLNQDLQSAYNSLVVYKGDIKKIQRFIDGYNMQIQDFQSIKQGYRNTVNQVFQYILQTVKNEKLKAQLKFRIFCCHLINRVFKTGVKEDIFPNYESWKKQKNNTDNTKCINFSLFEQWIGIQAPQRLLQEIKNIDRIFYQRN